VDLDLAKAFLDVNKVDYSPSLKEFLDTKEVKNYQDLMALIPSKK
jgi:hypothetical protein